MITRLIGGRIYDPANGKMGVGQDLFIEDGRIVAPPRQEAIGRAYDLAGRIVMAGAIDIHSHVAGGKVNLARLLMAEDHHADVLARGDLTRAGSGHATPS